MPHLHTTRQTPLLWLLLRKIKLSFRAPPFLPSFSLFSPQRHTHTTQFPQSYFLEVSVYITNKEIQEKYKKLLHFPYCNTSCCLFHTPTLSIPFHLFSGLHTKGLSTFERMHRPYIF